MIYKDKYTQKEMTKKIEFKIEKEELLIGLLADTHVPSRTNEIPKDILDDFKQHDIDLLFHLGDFTSLNSYNQIVEEFGKDKIIAISGNMDDENLSNQLPESIELELFGHRIFMTHGMGGPNAVIRRLNKYYDLSSYEIIIFGHVHRPYNERGNDGKLYLNPGTPTDKRFTDINSYGYLRISKDKIEPNIIEI